MAREVIDLCSSPEPDESPSRTLASFLPRKNKIATQPGGNLQNVRGSKHRDSQEEQWLNETGIENRNGIHTNGVAEAAQSEPLNKAKEGKTTPSFRIEKTRAPTRRNGSGALHQRLELSSPRALSPQGQLYLTPYEERSNGSQKYALHNGKLPSSRPFSPQNGLYSTSYGQRSYGPRHVSENGMCDPPQQQPHSNNENSKPLTDSVLTGAGLEVSRTPESKRNSSLFPPELNPSQSSRNRATPILSGGGLEVRRAPEANNTGVEVEHTSKRQASSSWSEANARAPKKLRADASPDKDTRHERDNIDRGKTIFIDVTDPYAERVTYSDEPEPDPETTTTTMKGASPKNTRQTDIGNQGPRRADFSRGPNRNGEHYIPEEDELLRQLKEEDGLDWNQIVSYFNGRTKGSLQVRYSSKIAVRQSAATGSKPDRWKSSLAISSVDESSDAVATGRGKRSRKSAPSVLDGFVSWASLKKRHDTTAQSEEEEEVENDLPESSALSPSLKYDTAFPQKMSQILRHRELGSTSSRAWCASRGGVSDQMKDHVHDSYALTKQYHGASGDVVALSWAPDGDRFAAGSIAISDNRSMQYNMQRNLLVGSHKRALLHELVEHHVPRPLIEESDNVNALDSMRLSQDPRLFKTVTATAFAPRSSKKLYTTGEDKMLRRYTVSEGLKSVKCRYEVSHPARIDLLAVSYFHGMVATGTHTESESIRLFRCHERDYETRSVFSPSRSDLQSAVPIFPSTLKWGIAHQHQAMLLVGFAGEEEKQYAGETCLWNVEHGTTIPLRAATRNVFDVAWNPNPSAASITFAVASEPTGLSVSRGTRSAIQCFAPNQQAASRVLTWECPAPDINDVLFCPYDDNLIAAGATNGTVYIWDRRSAERAQKPLHILHHGTSENIVAHDRDPDTADTGVRFLSWGATKNRLYSGSHDGVVKIWNPYRSANNAHVDDIAPARHERTAVMSGTFSPDGRDLLIGTENGRINLFSIAGGAVYRPQQFTVKSAPVPGNQHNGVDAAQSMINSGQIQIRPCGSMPFRQAVQGPNYSGPFLAPSKGEWEHAEKKYNNALIAQSNAQSNVHDDENADTGQADSDVLTAQQRLNDLEERLKHFQIAEPKAKQFQQSLVDAEQTRAQLLSVSGPVDACDRSCAFLPISEEIEDSGRSELRIPDKLRSVVRNAALAEMSDDNATATCASCFPAQAMRSGKKRTFCAACQLKSDRLTASCSQCSGPARLEMDASKPTLCERCAFSCFRCEGSLEINDEMTCVSCPSCALTWEMRALGYELVSAPKRRQMHRDLEQDNSDLEADCDDDQADAVWYYWET